MPVVVAVVTHCHGEREGRSQGQAAQVPTIDQERRGTRLLATAWLRRPVACGEWPRDRHNRPAGEELGTDPAERTAVNVGTGPVSPRLFREAGKAQRLLMASGGGIALVVVAGVTTGLGGRESRLQGEVAPSNSALDHSHRE